MNDCIFFIDLCEDNIIDHYDLINVLGHFFQSFCNHEIFVKLNLPTFLVLLGQ